jgi:tetratricopeptide (TPR) repeat protein
MHAVHLFVAAVLLSVAAHAESTEPREGAHRLSTEGTDAYKAGEYAKAVERFSAAYRLYPAPPLLLNLSRAELKLSRCAEALQHAQQFQAAVGDTLAGSPDAPDAWITTIQRTCIEAVVDSTPQGATIWIDNERQTSPDKTPWSGRLTVGPHKILLWREGFQEQGGTLEVTAGAPARLTLALLTAQQALQPIGASPTSSVAPSAPKASENALAAPAPMRWQRKAGWGLAAAGVVVLAAGLAMGVTSHDQQSEVHTVHSSAATDLGLMRNSNSLAIGADTSFAVGGVLAAAGAGLIVVF